MNILATITSQSRALLWAELLGALTLLGCIDPVTPWTFGLFMFYAGVIFAAAWALGVRAALGFVAVAMIVSWFANLETYPLDNLHGYAWSAANRFVGFLFGAACGAALRSYRDEADARVQEMERARHLERQIVGTAESEQRRIGRDLHDGVCQSLSAIVYATEILKHDLESGGNQPSPRVSQIQQMLKDAIVELRSLAHSMAPVNLSGDGLSAALEALVATVGQVRESSVHYHTGGDIQITDPAAALHLYRIAQEALGNALKHAEATRIDVTLRQTSREILLRVSDNGNGLPANVHESAGIGLHTMKYRAHLLGGSLRVGASELGGLAVECRIPRPVATPEPALAKAPALPAVGAPVPVR